VFEEGRVMKLGQRRHPRAACAIALLLLGSRLEAQDAAPTLDDVQRLFYNGQYEKSAALALSVPTPDLAASLAIDEVRSSALLFQVKRLLDSPDRTDKQMSAKDKLKHCAECPALIDEFMTIVRHGQELAREHLDERPDDQTPLFFLGKLDLNYVWLQLGPLGKKTGWSEYWEARHSLDAVLKADPDHVRARVARAWMEYIVDTRLPWGTEWLLGGGDKKKALRWIQEAAARDDDFFAQSEAEFALWEMLVREKQLPKALDVADRLLVRFPENRELMRFVEEGGPRAER
jgi:hypothetical protein